MKTILVPTDFSDCAYYASETAIELAKLLDADVHFYHFMSLPFDWDELPESSARSKYPELFQKVLNVQDKLSELVDLAKQSGVSASTIINYDGQAENIIDHVNEYSTNMIVMGSHGAHGLREFFMGSNAQKIVRLSKVPVLIIKESQKTIKVPNVLFVSNFEDEMFQPFEEVMELVHLLNAKVTLLYINTPEEFKETWKIDTKMESFIALAGDSLNKAETINAHYFGEGLRRYCEKNRESILTLATHQSKGLSKIFLGGMAEKIVNHIDIPVISFPIKEMSGYPRY